MTQEQALRILKSGENIFLTGSAGAGKTYVLNQYIDYLKARKIRVAITASTGIAATHMAGLTIHSWSGIGIKTNISSRDLKNMEKKQYLKKNLEKVKVLIVDEISMLHKNQLDAVNVVLKHFKNSTHAFGGIQVIFAGDFFQLPPIGDEPSRNKFAFMSAAWVEAQLKVCYLTEQYRQNDQQLNDILNEIRNGNVSPNSIHQLQLAEKNTLSGKITPTKLYTHNIDVDRINQDYLASLNTPAKTFTAVTKGNEKILEVFKKSVQAPEKMELKIGAKVMFVKNNPEVGYVNGSLGEIIAYSEVGFPIVQLVDGRKITANHDSWSILDDAGKTLAKYDQVPLRLAWAITIHKSQGMTLDAAEIDLSKTFELGQGYVALSRLKQLRNLTLFGFNQQALTVDGLALKADARFRQLSAEAEQFCADKVQMERYAQEFIVTCEGLINAKEIEKEAKKVKEKKLKKSTYQITKELIEAGFGLSEISTERGCTEGTVVNHIIKLHAEFPRLDLNKFKTKPADMVLIKKAYQKVKSPKKPLSIGAMFKELEGKYTFEQIKLALLWI